MHKYVLCFFCLTAALRGARAAVGGARLTFIVGGPLARGARCAGMGARCAGGMRYHACQAVRSTLRGARCAVSGAIVSSGEAWEAVHAARYVCGRERAAGWGMFHFLKRHKKARTAAGLIGELIG